MRTIRFIACWGLFVLVVMWCTPAQLFRRLKYAVNDYWLWVKIEAASTRYFIETGKVDLE